MPDEHIQMPVKLVEAIYQFLTQLPLPMVQAQVAINLVQGIQTAGAAHNAPKPDAPPVLADTQH